VQHNIDVEKMPVKDATSRAMKDITAPVIGRGFNSCFGICSCCFYSRHCRSPIPTVCHYHSGININSAFIALSLTPALCTLLLKPHHLDEKSKGLNKFFIGLIHGSIKFLVRYAHGVKRGIHSSKYVIVLLICIWYCNIFLFKFKPAGFIPNEDLGRVQVYLRNG